jgi:ribosomal protein S12 methylthiotransferase
MNAVAQNANICSYFDIPIQHASRSILKKMGRHYGPDDLRLMLERIRRLMPEAALRTTVIVGFPGETDADFDELLRFVESERFNHLGCFVYSDSEDLPSHRLPDHVPAEIARERHRILMKRQQKISAARNREYKDQKVAVLVEEHQENGLYTGRTEFQAPEVDGVTYIHADRLQTGCFAMVRITDTLEYDLVGEAV